MNTLIQSKSLAARCAKWAWFLAFSASFCGFSVVVEWDPNTESSLAGYRVYWGRQSRGYDSVIDVGNSTVAQLPTPTNTTYFAVTAYDTNGLESDFSEEVFYVAPQAPIATPDAYSTVRNQSLNISASSGVLANDSDANDDVLSAILVSGTANGTLALQLNGSFNYTPNTDFSGVDTFSYAAIDGTSTSSVVTVTLTVNEPTATNRPPIAVANAYSTPYNQILNVNPANGVLANDSDPDGDALSAFITAVPSSGILVFNANGSFTYRPATNSSGVFQFSYRTTDGQATSSVAVVTLTVNPPPPPTNRIPVSVSDSYSLVQNQTFNIGATGGVLANDSDADGHPLTALLVSAPASGTLSLSANGAFTYQPASNFVGAVQFSYRVTDGQSTSSVAIVTLTVLELSCEECLDNLESALAERAQFVNAIQALRTVHTNGTCIDLTVAAFKTVARMLGSDEDSVVSAALTFAAECISAKLQQEFDLRDAKSATLPGSRWTTVASNKVESAREKLNHLAEDAPPLICAQIFSAAAVAIKRADRAIVSGELAPATLEGQVFQWKRSRTEKWYVSFSADTFTVETLDGSPVGQGAYVYSRTAWNRGQMLLSFNNASIGTVPDEIVTVNLKFTRTTAQMSGAVRGTLRRFP